MTTPTRLGRFRILSQLGSGAFSVVYRAVDPQLDREIALKVARSLPQQTQAPERFLREARAAAKLRHPHIVPVYDAGTDGETRYLTTRLIDGRSLEAALKETPLPLEQRVRIVRDLADALAYAHQQGIVHRDVKPANVLLDRNGKAYLADFGLAHLRDEAERLTHDGTILGTPAYMAPEQARGQQGPPLPASDQYSLGAVLYELLTGQPPFTGATPSVLHKVVHEQPLAPRRMADVPRDLDTICLKTLAKNPDERYPDCRQLAGDLRRWLDDEPISARRRSLWEQAAHWCKREPWLAAGVALALGSFLAAVGTSIGMATVRANAVHQEQAARDKLVAQQARSKATREAAEQAAEEAENARVEVEREATNLDEKTIATKTAQENATKKVEEAGRVEAELTQREKDAAHYRYVGAFVSAQTEADEKQVVAALERMIPTSGEDLRGFEWYYLRAHPEKIPSPITLTGISGEIHQLGFTPAGNLHFVTVSRGPGGPGDAHQYLFNWSLGQQLSHRKFSIDAGFFNDRTRRFFLNSPTGDAVVIPRTSAAPLLWLSSEAKPRILKAADLTFQPALSKDGTRIALQSDREVIAVQELESGKNLQSVTVPMLTTFTLSDDGKMLAAIGARKNAETMETVRFVRIVELATAKETEVEIAPPQSRGLQLRFVPGGKLLALLLDDSVQYFSIQTAKLLGTHRFDVNHPAIHLVFSPDGHWAMTAEGHLVDLDSLSKGSPDVLDKGKTKFQRLTDVSVYGTSAFSPDNRWLITVVPIYGNEQQFVQCRLRELSTGKEFLLPLPNVWKTPPHPNGPLAITPDQKWAVLGRGDGMVTLHPLSSRYPGLSAILPGKVQKAALAERGQVVVARCNGQLVIVDQNTNTFPRRLVRTGGIADFSCATEMDLIAVVTTQGGCVLGSVGTLPSRKNEAVTPTGTSSVALSADGKRLATLSTRGQLEIYKADDKKVTHSWDTGETDGRLTFAGTLIALSSKGKIRIWNLDTKKGYPAFRAYGEFAAVAFNRDGTLLAVAESGQRLRLHRPDNEATIAQLRGGLDITAIAFSPDGKTLATGEKNGSVRLWNVATSEELLWMGKHDDAVTELQFTPDGTVLFSFSPNGEARQWTAPR